MKGSGGGSAKTQVLAWADGWQQCAGSYLTTRASFHGRTTGYTCDHLRQHEETCSLAGSSSSLHRRLKLIKIKIMARLRGPRLACCCSTVRTLTSKSPGGMALAQPSTKPWLNRFDTRTVREGCDALIALQHKATSTKRSMQPPVPHYNASMRKRRATGGAGTSRTRANNTPRPPELLTQLGLITFSSNPDCCTHTRWRTRHTPRRFINCEG